MERNLKKFIINKNLRKVEVPKWLCQENPETPLDDIVTIDVKTELMRGPPVH